jgi:hypothetical protein
MQRSYVTSYEKRDHLGKTVVHKNLIYHDNVQLAFYTSVVLSIYLYRCVDTNIEQMYSTSTVHYSIHTTSYMYMHTKINGPFSHSWSHIIIIRLSFRIFIKGGGGKCDNCRI